MLVVYQFNFDLCMQPKKTFMERTLLSVTLHMQISVLDDTSWASETEEAENCLQTEEHIIVTQSAEMVPK